MDNMVITCDNVSKVFETQSDQIKVLEDINIQAKHNEILVLFGPGQCGLKLHY